MPVVSHGGEVYCPFRVQTIHVCVPRCVPRSLSGWTTWARWCHCTVEARLARTASSGPSVSSSISMTCTLGPSLTWSPSLLRYIHHLYGFKGPGDATALAGNLKSTLWKLQAAALSLACSKCSPRHGTLDDGTGLAAAQRAPQWSDIFLTLWEFCKVPLWCDRTSTSS